MIDRIEELKRMALRKSVWLKSPVHAPSRHCYVGIYEDFVKA